MNILLVGAGGAGAWTAMLATRILDLMNPDGKDLLLLVDGDVLETKNLDRQYFGRRGLGQTKVAALKSQLLTYVPQPSGERILTFPQYLTDEMVEEGYDSTGWVIVCAVDNHSARRRCLSLAATFGNVIISLANELTDSEAWWWHRGLPMAYHPFALYPELEFDQRNDPTRPGCVGPEAGPNGGQLAHANFLAAGMGMHLLNYLTTKGMPLHQGTDTPRWVYQEGPVFINHRCNRAKFMTQVKGDL